MYVTTSFIRLRFIKVKPNRVGNGDGVTGDGEVTGDKIFTGEAFSPVKLT